MMPITEEVRVFLTANAAAQIQRDDEYLDPLMDCCTARPVMACGKRSFLLPAEQVFSDHAACALARVLRKNSAKQQKKNGSVWNAFSVGKHMGYRIAASTIARLPTITEKRQG